MSAQTGIETPRGPASQRIGDRMRFRFARWRSQPNPLWMREMRQSTRQLRTPIILMVVTLLVTLLMSSLGGLMTGSTSPAKAGSVMFQVYFSVAWCVVTLVGPALAANSIASEREGRTWEAVLLTGMQPDTVARGKFLAAYTAIGMYVVMLAPVGALPFLFGGVTPIEVALAFTLLFMIALLSVTFGLAVSSKMESMRAALMVTLLVAIPLSGACYGLFGVGMADLAHDQWRAVPDEMPVWLPIALVRVPFSAEYFVYLVCLPVAALTLSPWLLYEITRANLTNISDDRTFGLKKWYVVATLVLTACALVPIFSSRPRHHAPAAVGGIICLCMYITFCAFLFAGEPIGPSRRVRAALESASRRRRWLSPGIATTTRMQMFGTIISLLLLAVICLVVVSEGGHDVVKQSAQIVVFALYAIGFSMFTVGLAGFMRSRSTSGVVPRVLLLVVLFGLITGPWILAAITGLMSGSTRAYGPSFVVAAPSPAYAIVALDAIERGRQAHAVPATIAASFLYGLLGLLFGAFGNKRARAIITAHEEVLAEADRRLAEEDAWLAAQWQPTTETEADTEAETEAETETTPPDPEPED